MKPYQHVLIRDCAEPLVEIPTGVFAVESPHAYVKLGAPYGDKSPYYLRQGVLQKLLCAQDWLQQHYPQWRIQIFDAYRPIGVQQFMVDYSFKQAVQKEGMNLETLSETQRQTLLAKVYQFWATPSPNPATPPPHSTGAAIDVTLVNAQGQVVDMGSPIDEMSPRSYPDYYAYPDPGIARTNGSVQIAQDSDPANRTQFHQNRLLLKTAMLTAGFAQHPQEWWHFSYGDQLWAWTVQQKQPDYQPVACYGAI